VPKKGHTVTQPSTSPAPSLRALFSQTTAPAIGAFCSLPDPTAAELLASAGYDFVLVDAQHGGPTMDSLAALIPAIDGAGSAALVRMPWNDPALIMRALDLGAAGVIVPMVSTARDAELAVSACRYPPAGIRSYGQLRGRRYASTDATNEQVLCIVMIETAEGLENIEAIAATEGVDGIFIGPIDLALSMGLAVDFTLSDPALTAAMERIVQLGRAQGTAVGVPLFGMHTAQRTIDAGYGFITVGADTGYIRAGAGADVTAIRAIIKGDSA
jgi:4-hydroxy-2-oxoheptanedioate aldolase